MPVAESAEPQPRRPADVKECPGEEALLRFARGVLAAAELEAFDLHLDGCLRRRALAGWACRSEPGAAHKQEARAVAVAPGSRVGRYVIERLVGAGSMG